MAGVVGFLVPLRRDEEAQEASPVPIRDGVVTIGRRASCTIVLRDVAVSGTHCIVTCHKPLDHGGRVTFQVEDRSTNGTFVNDARFSLGQCSPLGDGDVISLTKPPCAQELEAATCIQFRFDVRHEAVVVAESRDTVQDLLEVEQRNKTHVTNELLSVRRQLVNERGRAETLRLELRKAQGALDGERTRRTAARETRERLQSDGEQLRQDRQRLVELRTEHEMLREKHECIEVELGTEFQRAAALEATHERLKTDLERSRGDAARAEAHLGESAKRLQNVQERLRQMEGGHREARRCADDAERETERLQREFSGERATHDQLAEQDLSLSADAERAELRGKAARDTLAEVEVQLGELVRNAVACNAEIARLQAEARSAQQRSVAETEMVEVFHAAAARFIESLQACAYGWQRHLPEDVSDGSVSRIRTPAVVPVITTAVCSDKRQPVARGAEYLDAVASIGRVEAKSSDPSKEEAIPKAAAVQPPAADGADGNIPATAFQDEIAQASKRISTLHEEELPITPPQTTQVHVPLATPPPAASCCDRAQIVSLVIGSQETFLMPPPPTMKREALAAATTHDSMAAKRSATESVLVMPGLDLGRSFKRARPARVF